MQNETEKIGFKQSTADALDKVTENHVEWVWCGWVDGAGVTCQLPLKVIRMLALYPVAEMTSRAGVLIIGYVPREWWWHVGHPYVIDNPNAVSDAALGVSTEEALNRFVADAWWYAG